MAKLTFNEAVVKGRVLEYFCQNPVVLKKKDGEEVEEETLEQLLKDMEPSVLPEEDQKKLKPLYIDLINKYADFFNSFTTYRQKVEEIVGK